MRRVADIAESDIEGRSTIYTWRKSPSQVTTAGIWFDLSMSPGNPAPNYYIGSPNVFVPLRQSTDGGLRHGGAVNAQGSKKHLRRLMAMTPTAAGVADYLSKHNS